jgi:SAM-dependent methyltransferase
VNVRPLEAVYDRIGRSYATFRATDPDIAAAVTTALDGATTVVNVGAGTGSYESCAPRCVAVEPSEIMITQRPSGGPPVVRATAEQLPFTSTSYDAAMALLTIHHWTDLDRGLAELQRVARRVVVLTFDAEVHDTFWLFDEYLPEATAAASQRPLAPVDVAARLGTRRIEVLPIPPRCQDGFTMAYWRRPGAYLDPAVRACCSTFADLPPALVEARMDRLAADVESGRWEADHQELMNSRSFDGGLRLVVAG